MTYRGGTQWILTLNLTWKFQAENLMKFKGNRKKGYFEFRDY